MNFFYQKRQKTYESVWVNINEGQDYRGRGKAFL